MTGVAECDGVLRAGLCGGDSDKLCCVPNLVRNVFFCFVLFIIEKFLNFIHFIFKIKKCKRALGSSAECISGECDGQVEANYW